MDYASRHANSFSFPVLKPSELQRCMADIGIALSEEDLSKPSMQRVLAVYERFTDLFMATTYDQYCQPNFAVEMLDHPELYQDSIGLIAYYRQVRKLMSGVGIDDFSMRDILRPEPPRVRRCFSAVINFAKFREERMGFFESCVQKGEEAAARKEHLEQTNRELSEQVNTLRLQRAEQEPTAEKLRDKNAAITADLRELQKQQTILTSESESLRKDKTDLADRLSKAQMTIMNLKQECIRLKSRIVQSPEKLKASISDMNNSVQNEKASVAMIEKRARELQGKIDMMSLVEQDIAACLRLMDECEIEKNKAEVACDKTSSDRESIEKRRADIRELHIKEEQMKRQLNSAHDKLTRLQKHQCVKAESISSRLEKLKEEHKLVFSELTQSQRKAEEYDSSTREYEEKTKELKMQESVDSAGLEDLFNKISTEISIYQNAIEKAMSAGRLKG